jgi:hypothetical protein
VIRDSLLAVSGRLELRRGGRPVEKGAEDPEAACRTIYLLVDRQHIAPIAQAFDFPSADFTVGVRSRTQVPQQQLFFLNSNFVRRQAESLVDRVMQAVPDSESGRLVDQLFRRVMARDPTPAERRAAMEFLDGERKEGAGEADSVGYARQSWIRLAHALLQSNHLAWLD